MIFIIIIVFLYLIRFLNLINMPRTKGALNKKKKVSEPPKKVSLKRKIHELVTDTFISTDNSEVD